MFKVFIAENILRTIIQAESQQSNNIRSNLFRILKSAKNLFVSMDSPDLEWIKQLKDDYDLTVDTTMTSYIKNIPAEPGTVLKNPSSLFVLDITPTEAKGIQNNYGVMCISSEKLDYSQLIDVNDRFSPSPGKKKFKGWDKVLDSVERLPSNAILIKDRYLFSSRNKNFGDGLSNVKYILNELLPLKFDGGDYHITIVFDIDETASSFTFNDIAHKLNDLAYQVRSNYPIMMEVFGITEACTLYNDTHDRHIVSNYFFVEASHKLAAFTPEFFGTVKQSITPWALFTDSSLKGNSSAPLESIDQTVEGFRNFYNALSNAAEHSTYLYAVNGKRFERCIGVRNRLLK